MFNRLEVLWLFLWLDVLKRTDWRIYLILRSVDTAIFRFIHSPVVLRLLLHNFLRFFEAIGVVFLRRGPFIGFVEMSVGDLRCWCDLRVAFVHDILEGSESMVNEVKMQRDKPKQEDRKDQNHKRNRPIDRHLRDEVSPLSFSPQQSHSYQIHQHVKKHCDDHSYERWVIFPPNAVIDPYAMMIEPIHASKSLQIVPIADLTVSRWTDDITLAMLAVETWLVTVKTE